MFPTGPARQIGFALQNEACTFDADHVTDGVPVRHSIAAVITSAEGVKLLGGRVDMDRHAFAFRETKQR